jgi:hypothetical protein
MRCPPGKKKELSAKRQKAPSFEDNRYSLVGIIFIGSGDIAGKDAEYAGNLF